MKIETRIALRYVFSFREFRIISIISMISFLGIVIGVAAIISASSIFNGFREFTENQLMGFDPHLRIISANGPHLGNYEKILNDLKQVKEIKASSPIVSGKLIAINKSNLILVKLFGVKENEFGDVSGIEKSILVGRYKLLKESKPMLIIGSGLSDKLRAMPGDQISLLPFKDMEYAIKTLSMQNGYPVMISGIFQTHNQEYDDLYAYSEFDEVKQILSIPAGSVSSLDIRLFDVGKTEEIRNRIEEKHPETEVQTWYTLHRELYNVMQLERVAVFIVLSLIILLAVFNVLASISMTVVEKKRDIGILMAMGAKSNQIGSIFLRESMIIGTLGTILGVIIGLLLCFGQQEYGWFKLSAEKFLITSIPVEVYFWDIIAVIAVSLVLSFISGLIPSRRAAKTQISENIRFE